MQRLNRSGFRIANNIARFSSNTKDEASRLVEASLAAKNTSTEEAQGQGFQKKIITNLPKTQLKLTSEEIARAAAKVDTISQKVILGKGVSEKMRQLPSSIDAKEAPRYLTGNFYAWSKSPYERVNIQQDGSILLLNSDKRVLINQFVSLVDKGVIALEKQILLLNEGCDNGDFLGLMIPYLSDRGSELKIVLVNGNEKKLQEAAHFSKSLLNDQDVEYILHNSFDSIPKIVSQFSNYQTFHLFFRLPVVERYSVVTNFTEKRLASMKPADIAIGSYLLWNDVSINTMIHSYKNKPKDVRPDLGYITLEQEMTKSAKKQLLAQGATEEDAGIFTTAFTQEAVEDLITSKGGEILQITPIPTQTDAKRDIYTLGVIFRKRST